MLYYVQIFCLHCTTKCTQRLWGIRTFVWRAQHIQDMFWLTHQWKTIYSKTDNKYNNILHALPWVPEVFFSLGTTELSGEAAKESREAARKKPLAPTDNNLTSMPTPVSFDWHPPSELILETQQAGFTRVEYNIRVMFHVYVSRVTVPFLLREIFRFSLWISLNKLFCTTNQH